MNEKLENVKDNLIWWFEESSFYAKLGAVFLIIFVSLGLIAMPIPFLILAGLLFLSFLMLKLLESLPNDFK